MKHEDLVAERKKWIEEHITFIEKWEQELLYREKKVDALAYEVSERETAMFLELYSRWMAFYVEKSVVDRKVENESPIQTSSRTVDEINNIVSQLKPHGAKLPQDFRNEFIRDVLPQYYAQIFKIYHNQ